MIDKPIDKADIWSICGSYENMKFIGCDIYITIDGAKYKLTNKQLEQFKIEDNDTRTI